MQYAQEQTFIKITEEDLRLEGNAPQAGNNQQTTNGENPIVITLEDVEQNRDTQHSNGHEPPIKITLEETGGDDSQLTNGNSTVGDAEDGLIVNLADVMKSETEVLNLATDTIATTNRASFSSKTLTNLKGEIDDLRGKGKNKKQIFIALARKYHPDLTQNLDDPTRKLYNEYFAALSIMRDNNAI